MSEKEEGQTDLSLKHDTVQSERQNRKLSNVSEFLIYENGENESLLLILLGE